MATRLVCLWHPFGRKIEKQRSNSCGRLARQPLVSQQQAPFYGLCRSRSRWRQCHRCPAAGHDDGGYRDGWGPNQRFSKSHRSVAVLTQPPYWAKVRFPCCSAGDQNKATGLAQWRSTGAKCRGRESGDREIWTNSLTKGNVNAGGGKPHVRNGIFNCSAVLGVRALNCQTANR